MENDMDGQGTAKRYLNWLQDTNWW